MRVVLDTNVLISAFLFKGRIGKITSLIEKDVITPCFTIRTLQEFQEVLSRPKFQSVLLSGGLTPKILIEALLLHILLFEEINVAMKIPEDPSDEIFLSCALASGAEYLVSGDHHLLKLRKFETIPIISPANFLKYFYHQDKI